MGAERRRWISAPNHGLTGDWHDSMGPSMGLGRAIAEPDFSPGKRAYAGITIERSYYLNRWT